MWPSPFLCCAVFFSSTPLLPSSLWTCLPLAWELSCPISFYFYKSPFSSVSCIFSPEGLRCLFLPFSAPIFSFLSLGTIFKILQCNIPNIKFSIFNHFKRRFYLFIFRERRREGEREGENHQCVVASHMPPTGDLAHNPGN